MHLFAGTEVSVAKKNFAQNRKRNQSTGLHLARTAHNLPHSHYTSIALTGPLVKLVFTHTITRTVIVYLMHCSSLTAPHYVLLLALPRTVPLTLLFTRAAPPHTTCSSHTALHYTLTHTAPHTHFSSPHSHCTPPHTVLLTALHPLFRTHSHLASCTPPRSPSTVSYSVPLFSYSQTMFPCSLPPVHLLTYSPSLLYSCSQPSASVPLSSHLPSSSSGASSS
jgi:hypothetical protein